MNDPHVESLEYSLETDDTLEFDNPDAVERDGGSFTVRLADGVLTATMKDHFATQEEAVAVVWPFLRAWELDRALACGRREVHFKFVRSDIRDRKPTPGVVALAGSVTMSLTLSGTLTATRRRYPEAPVGFVVSSQVEKLWTRYEQYVEGRESLSGMAYGCLTFITKVVAHGETDAARKLAVSGKVLDKLGYLTSRKGERKYPSEPYSAQEEGWVAAAVRLLIRRVGEEAAGMGPLPQITMTDLPKLRNLSTRMRQSGLEFSE